MSKLNGQILSISLFPKKLASTLIPSEDANAIAERLVQENARLQIDLQQVKDELKALRSAQDLVSKKGEKGVENNFCWSTIVSFHVAVLRKDFALKVKIVLLLMHFK